MFRKVYLLALIAFLVAGCDQKALLQRSTPPDDDAFARHFLDVVRAGDYAAADQMLDASLRRENTERGLYELNAALANGEPLSVEVIGCDVFTRVSLQGTTRTTNLSYQIHFPSSWAIGNVVVGHPAGAPSVLGSSFGPISESLETTTRFTFSGKSFVHYWVFAACLAVPAFILVALVVCIRSRVRHKWRWIVFILLGFGRFQLVWTNANVTVHPIAVVLFGAFVHRAGPYAPWIVGFAIPVGAIAFLTLRRKLVPGQATQ